MQLKRVFFRAVYGELEMENRGLGSGLQNSRIHCHRSTSSATISVPYTMHDMFYLQETSAFDADLFYRA